jgi:hypothetical protein
VLERVQRFRGFAELPGATHLLQAKRGVDGSLRAKVRHRPLQSVRGVLDLGGVPLLDSQAKFRQCARAILYEEHRYLPQQLYIPAYAG